MSLATVSRPRSSLYMPRVDPALSSYAEVLRDDLLESREGLDSAPSITGRRAEASDHLWDAVFEEGLEEEIVADALWRAQCLLQSLPEYVPLPAIFIEEDGAIGLDWDEDRRRVISVSINETPMIRYSGLVGADRFAGRLAFDGTMPTTLSDLLRRLYPAPVTYHR